MTFGLHDTFANPQGCHIIREAPFDCLEAEAIVLF